MKGKHHKRIYLFLIIFLVLVVLFFYLLGPNYFRLLNPENIKNFVLSFGVFSAAVFILLQTFQVLVPLLPYEIITTVGGYLFGFWKGFLYSLLGLWAGSTILFLIGRQYGRKLVKKLVDHEHLRHFQAFLKRRGVFAYILANWLLVFPEDTLSLILVSFTKIRYLTYLAVTFIGYLPLLLILNLFGNEVAQKMENIWMVMSLVLVFGIILLYVFRKQIKRLLIKEARVVEKEVVEIEKRIR